MKYPRIVTTVALGLTLTVAVVGCSGQSTASPSPSASPSQAAAPSSAAPASSAPASTAPQSPAAAKSVEPSASAKPSASASGGASVADLLSKAKNAGEYSFTFKMSGPAAMTGKTYVKGTKTRQETSMAGAEMVMVVDSATRVAYTLMPSAKMAIKMDLSQAMDQVQRPTDRIGALPTDAKAVGTETIDGKTAAVFEVTDASGPGKFWVWTDRGVPLKVEVSSPQGKTTMEFTDYQFGSQPDSLFEVPADYQTMDLPTSIPGLPGGGPGAIPGVPGGIPGNIPVPGQ